MAGYSEEGMGSSLGWVDAVVRGEMTEEASDDGDVVVNLSSSSDHIAARKSDWEM